MVETRRETRFQIEWAECPNCGSENVYALHSPADTDYDAPPRLTVWCKKCESGDRRTGMEWVVYES